ncbi:hypothetical protein MSG28_010505 [Choristoneura fumiferana]|uniref:Uncharacterized protein n=1 Tax=Choristoneura fumiferana TaxID=7141 RepID=A0ACC0KL63_CHOFU|nr:hypothetical protein MSG28_010505 [Choristoneura fumiferana]
MLPGPSKPKVTDSRLARPYCACTSSRLPMPWQLQLQELELATDCACGEEDAIGEWTWQEPEGNVQNSLEFSKNDTQVTFHPTYSSGTATVRGDCPFHKDHHHYFEIKMLTDTYGTDIMVGVGTDKVNIAESRYKFTSLLGEDDQSYGLSYRGMVRHGAGLAHESAGFCRGSIVGVRVDLWHGTLDLNGISFFNLRRHQQLYPMVSSTAAQSKIRLIYAASWRASLLVDAAKILAASTTADNAMQKKSKESEMEFDKAEISESLREPTVVGVPNFNAAEDAATLRAAMKGFGTDEQAIIDILTSRSNIQRQAIAQAFTHEYGRDIIEDLKSELGGHFEDVIVALMRPPAEYLCKELHNCMEGMGTDENTLVEILCTRTKKEIAEIVDAYERLYNRPLAEHMCSETSGDFRRLLTLIVTSPAAWFATRLRAAMQGLGTDDRTLVRIVVSRSELDLAAIAREYERLYDKTLESEIRLSASRTPRPGLRSGCAPPSRARGPMTRRSSALSQVALKSTSEALSENTSNSVTNIGKSNICRKETKKLFSKKIAEKSDEITLMLIIPFIIPEVLYHRASNGN